MALTISPQVLEKLGNKNPAVTRREVEQCFDNRAGRILFDDREENKTDPPTQWFVAKTNKNRDLKIVFVRRGNDIHLKTAYDPNAEEVRIYKKYGYNV
jgi:hypothetical protein